LGWLASFGIRGDDLESGDWDEESGSQDDEDDEEDDHENDAGING